MHICRGYHLTQDAQGYMLTALDPATAAFRGAIRMNGSAVLLYRRLEAGAEEDDLVDELLRTYQVDEPRARRDVVALLDVLADAGLLTD